MDDFTWLPTTNSSHHGWYQTWTWEAYLASNHTDSTKNTLGKSSNRHSLAKAMLSHHEQQRAWSVWICEHEIHIIDSNLTINIQWKNQSDIKIFSRKQPWLYPQIYNLHFDQAYDDINISTQEPINLHQPKSQRRFWKYKITEDFNTHRIPFQNLISVLRERSWNYVHRSQPIILPQPHCSHTPCCSSSSTQLQNANIEPRWVKKRRFKHHGFQKAIYKKVTHH